MSSIKGDSFIGSSSFRSITWAECKTYPEMIGFLARGAINAFVSTLSTFISTVWNLGKTIVQFFMIDKAAINVMKALNWCVGQLWGCIRKVFEVVQSIIVNDFTKATWNFTVESILTPIGSLIKKIFAAIYENVIEPAGKFLGSFSCCKRKSKLSKSKSDLDSSMRLPTWLTNGLKTLAAYTIYPLNDYILSPTLNLISGIFKSATNFVGSVVKTTWKWTAIPIWDRVVYPAVKGITEFINVFFFADTNEKPEKKKVEEVDEVENKVNEVKDKDETTYFQEN